MHNPIRNIIRVASPKYSGSAVDGYLDFSIQDDSPLGLMMMGRNFGRALHCKKNRLHPRPLKQFRLNSGEVQVCVGQIFYHFRKEGIFGQMFVLPILDFFADQAGLKFIQLSDKK